MAAFDLGPDIERSRACRVRAGTRLAPRERVHAGLDAPAEQLVPGGVELHLVDPVAVAVVGAQLGRVLVGLARPGLDLGVAPQHAEGRDPVPRPLGALPLQRLHQRPVGLEGVVADQRWCLVDDVVGGGGGARRRDGHGMKHEG